MTTIQTIVEQAYREGQFIEQGGTLTDAETEEGIDRLVIIINGLFGSGVGLYLKDWACPATVRTSPENVNFPNRVGYDCSLALSGNLQRSDDQRWRNPPANVRLIVGLTTAATIYLPQFPHDGARVAAVSLPAHIATLTISGNGRYIGDADAVTFAAGASARTWLYRADLASWRDITTIDATADSPLSAEYDDFLICALAMRLAPRYGAQVSEFTAQAYQDGLARLKLQFAQPAHGASEEYQLSPTRQAFDGLTL